LTGFRKRTRKGKKRVSSVPESAAKKKKREKSIQGD